MTALRRFWPVIALIAGAALGYFEIHRAGGVTADNIFWVVIAGLVVLISIIDLVSSKRPPDANDRRDELPPPNPDV